MLTIQYLVWAGFMDFILSNLKHLYKPPNQESTCSVKMVERSKVGQQLPWVERLLGDDGFSKLALQGAQGDRLLAWAPNNSEIMNVTLSSGKTAGQNKM